MKKILKTLFTLLGIAIFVFCIVTEVDGVGRFANILFGVLFTLIGSFINISD